jgi:hypothetical protein
VRYLKSTMTFRHFIDVLFNESEPLVPLTGILQLLRSIDQMEAATCEGVEASVLKWCEHYGKITDANVRKWAYEDLKSMHHLELDDEMLRMFVTEADGDENCV